MNLHPVILSGGSGTRLWPMSRVALPKQFLRLSSPRSLFQETLLRAQALSPEHAPVVVCNAEHRYLVLEQMLGAGATPGAVILEPAARNTAPAITAAALNIAGRDPQGLMLVLPSDHLVRDVAGFASGVDKAFKAAADGSIVTFGITPAWPETGYGYIQGGAAPDSGAVGRILRFVEKPPMEVARALFESGDHWWNSGMFLFRADVYLEEIGRHAPEILEAVRRSLEKASVDADCIRLDATGFAAAPSLSIDYAVMEKTERGAVIGIDVGWSDVGSWSALWGVSDKDPDGNMVTGDVHLDGVSNCVVNAGHRMVAALGVKDVVIVETADAVLVAHKDASQRVKDVVEHLGRSQRSEHLAHRRVARPWGWYESIEKGDRFQVKRICLNVGAKISLQLHHHRSEHWVVVNGIANVVRGDRELRLVINESIFIPMGVKHRLENVGYGPLEVIEVQVGEYLGEDDIVRFEDAYNRV